MHGEFFTELSLVILVTAGVSIIMKLIRQPLILGYILSGLLVGPSFLGLIHSTEMFEAFSALGIALLLFIIGLGMNVSELRKLGKPIFISAATTLMTVGTLGYAIGSLAGFTRTESIIIAFSLFFSSTIIIVKILSDKKEANRLHGQIAIGVILLEDIVATLALLFVVAGENGGLSASEVLFLFVKGLVLLLLLFIANTRILGRLTKIMASSQELLFLFALAWGFGIATLFDISGFSIEVGALFAGVALASLPYSQEIAARLKPLRDFFVVLFFITLGQGLAVDNLASGAIVAIILSLVVMVLKPFAIISSLGLLGYPKRVAFKAGINLSQISEFSIILVLLAYNSGMVSEQLSAIITLIAIITITTSTYLMHYDNQLFKMFDRIKIKVFEKESVHRERRNRVQYPLILFGYHKGGHEFVSTFKQMGKRYVVIDYDPTIIDTLERQNIPNIYGDATDLELLEEIGIYQVKLVVSTFTEFEVTKQLVANVERANPNAVIVCHADNQSEALELYELGATYVMIPHYIGSEKVSAFIRAKGLNKQEFEHFRSKHLGYLLSHHDDLTGAKEV
ncbi:MAG: cation:proton antiporter [bacterium]|nr:cation:proton antiporter [bacterium]